MVPQVSDVQPASDRQRAFIADLLTRKQVNEQTARQIREGMAAGVSKRQASIWIDGLLRLGDRKVAPAAPKSTPSSNGDKWPTVLEGRYAVVDPADNTLKFYQVQKPLEGRWEGFTFLSVFASDERHPIKAFDTKKRVMDAIAADPQGALQKYGQELGVCGVCGRTLTDEVSRRFGIGPVCREKLGYNVPAPTELELATA